MSHAVLIEELNKPVVPIANQGFLEDGKSAAAIRGIPGVRILSESIPCECTVDDIIESGVSSFMDELVSNLTRPLTEEEKEPKAAEPETPPRIVFKGNIEEVNRFFYKRGWTDGLPVLLPTEEAVREMLSGTDLAPDCLIGKIEPRFGKVTVEKVAINAVMAGALPTHMPLLIAGLKDLLDPRSGFEGWTVSTGSWVPFWVINGPVRNDLHINSKSGMLSPGNIANAAIGRAMQLIIRATGTARPGIEDMGVMGNPGKYTMVVAENEEDSPWEPYHVECGFTREDSTITVSSPNSFWQMCPYGSDDKGILRGLSYNLSPHDGGLLWLIINPAHAGFLAGKGWTKQMIRDFLYEHSRAPLYQLREYYGISPGFPLPGENGPLMNAQDSISIFSSPDLIRIIVAGGPGNQMGILTGASIHQRITRKIEFPANWEKLVRKYGDVIPAYMKYQQPG
ncbi:MAG: hypothetical protein JXA46_18155 [Dehalococcoidales bacterium]|nr:hypothetical protein [Dehalococcoidales bacterium]